MLVLSRKPQQEVWIQGGIRVVVLGVQGDRVSLGFDVPKGTQVMRAELIGPRRGFR
ncbi:MAG TPA: carbon storage regulator [Dehalococcoidia bacterium]|jgi:carbon storage regulator CsrA